MASLASASRFLVVIIRHDEPVIDFVSFEGFCVGVTQGAAALPFSDGVFRLPVLLGYHCGVFRRVWVMRCRGRSLTPLGHQASSGLFG